MRRPALHDIAPRVLRCYRAQVTKGLVTWEQAVSRWMAGYPQYEALSEAETRDVIARILALIEERRNPTPKAKLIVPEPRTLGPKPRSRKERVIRKGEFGGQHVSDPEESA